MTVPTGTEAAPSTEPAGTSGAGDGQASTYTPPPSQADLDRIIEQRLTRERAKFAGFEDYKTKADQHDAMLLEMGSDQEKAVAKARQEERDRLTAEATPRIVRAEFKAAAKGVLTPDQLSALIEDLDLTKYVTATGDVDEEKVSKKIAAFAPPKDGKTTTQSRSLGQGNQPPVQSKPGDQGRLMAEKRFKKA